MSTLEGKASEVSVVIYDAPKPPRYIKFNKSFLNWMLYGVPLAIGLLICAAIIVLIMPSGKTTFTTPRLDIPSPMSSGDSELTEAQNRVKELEKENQAIQAKLALMPSDTSSDMYFGQILRPYGTQNLIDKGMLQLEQIDFSYDSQKSVLKFQLINPHPETKISGHIIVFQYSATETKIYPGVLQNSAMNGVKFSQGESFAVSRLRPTVAEFTGLAISNKVKFVIYIFNREGDLLIKHVTNDFVMNNKAQ